MREWRLEIGDPFLLTIAADVRFGTIDYVNDQTWELVFGGGEPFAISLRTFFGLRVKSFRMFPRFVLGSTEAIDPRSFSSPPIITKIYPNFIHLEFSPFPSINAGLDYWVPHSQGVSGRLTVSNKSNAPQTLQFEWVCQMVGAEGERMAPLLKNSSWVMAAGAKQISPVLIMSGGPHPGQSSFHSLVTPIELLPGITKKITWALAALGTIEESYNSAQESSSQNWEGQAARIEMVNSGFLDISTGDPDWDTVFWLAQKHSVNSMVGPTDHLPHPSFVGSRLPDQGYSLRGDGSDYGHLWDGQTPLDTYYLAGMLLPGNPELVKGLILNFLHTRNDMGELDLKPGLAGQRNTLMATPILADLAWRVFEITGDQGFLEQVFPVLLDCFRAWFSPKHDRDQDGIPEWDSPTQFNAEEHPLYSPWHPTSLGLDISMAESPTLCALLSNECNRLIQVARQIDQDQFVAELSNRAQQLHEATISFMDHQEYCFYDRDRRTDFSTASELLGERQGPGELDVHKSFEHPVRVLVRVITEEIPKPSPVVVITGVTSSGEPCMEEIGEGFKWHLGVGTHAGEKLFKTIDKITVKNLGENNCVRIHSLGFRIHNLASLMPLWSGDVPPENASHLVKKTLYDSEIFWKNYGFPTYPTICTEETDKTCNSVEMIWNSLIGEGLVRYGYRQQAAELVSRLVGAVIRSLKREQVFRRSYHAITGEGIGEQNTLQGLAPLALFMQTLGVKILSPRKVVLAGFNPFPWPVTVKYRGLIVIRQKEHSRVIFPDGQTMLIEDPRPRIVSLD